MRSSSIETPHASPNRWPGPRPSRRPRTRRWVWAGLGSAAGHLVLLAILAAQRSPGPASPAYVAALPAPAAELAAEPVLIDIAVAPLDSTILASPPSPEPAPHLWGARQGDREHDVPRTTAPRLAEDPQRATPAPDRGPAGGQTPRPVYRRDQSSLAARVTDGAQAFQPSHQRLSARASSPQAIRREPLVGIRDATRTRTPARLPTAASYAPPEPPAGGTRAGDSDGARAGAAEEPEFPRVAKTPSTERGEGPLDAERGKRTFDIDRRGPATDDRPLRLASAERQPGIADFSHPAAPALADAAVGRGPADAPGVVPRPSAGLAPSEHGAPDAQTIGPEVSERTQDRRYDRYLQEITSRVNRQRVFPKKLALRLEQGETIVYFVLRADGKISDGVRVVKSSGFDEFDSEAARAVLRAAPFPPMPDPANARPIPVSLRVAFENPLVR